LQTAAQPASQADIRKRNFFSLFHLPKRSAAVKIVLIWSVAALLALWIGTGSSSDSGPFFYALMDYQAI